MTLQCTEKMGFFWLINCKELIGIRFAESEKNLLFHVALKYKVLLIRLSIYFLTVCACVSLYNTQMFVRDYTVYVNAMIGNEGEQVSAISPCSPSYPLFTQAVSMATNEWIATWMIGANPPVIGLIMDTHSGK